MEGLIKGLIDVALGHDGNKEEDSAARDRDEQSRSTWSEVIITLVISSKSSSILSELNVSTLISFLKVLAKMRRWCLVIRIRMKMTVIAHIKVGGIDRFG